MADALPLFLYGFVVAFWLWAKWLFAPQMFFLPPLPPVEVLVSLVENTLGQWAVALVTLSSLALIAIDALKSRRVGRLQWWSRSLLRGSVETVLIHGAVWIAGTILFFAVMALMPGAEVRGKSADDPLVRGLLLFTAFLSLIMAGPITGLVVVARTLGRQRRDGFPSSFLETLNHTVAILFVPLLILWILSGYPRATLRALRQDSSTRSSGLAENLVTAARDGDAASVQSFLRRGGPVNAKDHAGTTALISAAANGYLEIVQLLVQAGADVNAQDAGGRNALMSAATNRQPGIVAILLKAGANPNAMDLEGKTALLLAASAGDREIVSLLIQSRAEVNAASTFGETALMAASRRGWTDVVRTLITSGADIHARNHEGESALKLALKYNHTETAKVLRTAGSKD
jgi:hypothetical protein